MVSASRDERLNVGLLWHTFGHGNRGVDALARGHAQLLRRAALKAMLPVRMTSLGSGQNYLTDLPPDVTIGPAPQLKQLLKGNFDFLRAIRACDVVFDIGEGDSFTDIYGTRRCARLTATKLAVLASGKPLVLAPQTIGPFQNPVNRRIAFAVMRKATGVFTRDALSTQFLKENGFTSSEEFIDVAFAVPIVRQDRAANRVRICLNVSGLLYNEGYTGKNELGMTLNYKELTHGLIEELQSRPGVEIHLLAHVHGSGDADDDIPVMGILKARYPELVQAPLFETFSQTQSYISGMDFVIAARMHACISAFSAGVPVVPIAYSRKFNGLFDTLGYRHYVDGKVAQSGPALQSIVEAFDRRDALAADVKQGLAIVESRLSQYEDRLVRILTDVRNKAGITMER